MTGCRTIEPRPPKGRVAFSATATAGAPRLNVHTSGFGILGESMYKSNEYSVPSCTVLYMHKISLYHDLFGILGISINQLQREFDHFDRTLQEISLRALFWKNEKG